MTAPYPQFRMRSSRKHTMSLPHCGEFGRPQPGRVDKKIDTAQSKHTKLIKDEKV